MILKDLIKKLKAFDCQALNNKEVAHYFVGNHAYSYEEVVQDVMFDPKNNRIVLICKDPEEKIWDSAIMVKCENEKPTNRK